MRVVDAINQLSAHDGDVQIVVAFSSEVEGCQLNASTSVVDALNVLQQFPGDTELTTFSMELAPSAPAGDTPGHDEAMPDGQ